MPFFTPLNSHKPEACQARESNISLQEILDLVESDQIDRAISEAKIAQAQGNYLIPLKLALTLHEKNYPDIHALISLYESIPDSSICYSWAQDPLNALKNAANREITNENSDRPGLFF